MRSTLGRCLAIFERDARIALRQPVTFAIRWFSPIVAIAGFYFVSQLVDPHRSLAIDGRHRGYFAYVSINLSFMLLQTTALQAASSTIRYDQLIGTLEPILATPARSGLYVAACGLWPLAVSLGQVALSLAAAALWMGLDLHATNLASLAAFAILSTLTMGALGIFSASGVVAFKASPPTGLLVGGAATLLAGTLFPTRLFPSALQVASWCLPLTHALRGLRGAVAGESLSALGADATWLAVAAIVTVPASLATLSYAVDRAKRDGTLNQH